MLHVIPDSTPVNAFFIILYILLHKNVLAILSYLYFTFFGDFLMTSQSWSHDTTATHYISDFTQDDVVVEDVTIETSFMP